MDILDDTDVIFNCGDQVGYGPEPNLTVEKIIENEKIRSVMGNHDAALYKPEKRNYLNEIALKAILYHRQTLTEKNLNHVQGIQNIFLDHEFHGRKIRVCHDSPDHPGKDEYLREKAQFNRIFSWMENKEYDISVVGHTHRQMLVMQDSTGIEEIISFSDKSI
ncbi:hypothetical protein GF327_10080, partial [Candidatus Woesearchaeota archaeon]|nr:hypothetical protein [Candidatus Woesearchaeota archaeon]